jgi:glycosyltransferase involved in cell wall biosynthesis
VKVAIQSVLAQTLSDFELIIIDDGSTDKSLEIIKSFKDPRMRIITRENRGLVSSLNEGISLAKGNLIARQDADDISEPTRLEKQVSEFEKNKDLVLLGTSIRTINMAGDHLNNHHVLTGENAVKAELLIRSPFAHGSVMFRKEAFIKAGEYKQDEWPAEDYGLWVRMAQYGSFNNLDTPLYSYRENDSGISAANHGEQLNKARKATENAWNASHSLLRYFGIIHGQATSGASDRLAENYIRTYRMAQKRRAAIAQLKLLSMLCASPLLMRKITGKIRRSI